MTTLTEVHDKITTAILFALRDHTDLGPLSLGLLGAALTHGERPKIADVLDDIRAGGDPVLVQVALQNLDGETSTEIHVRLSTEQEKPIAMPDDSKVIAARVFNLGPPIRPLLPLLN
jgi:hypothetical protein